MRFTVFVLLLCISSCSCNDEKEQKIKQKEIESSIEISFDKDKWSTKKGETYPFREKMLNDVIYNDDLRKLKRKELVELLGEPSRVNNEYSYYLIEQTKALFITLHAKTLVIKFKEDDTVEWMKVHE